MLKQFVFMRFTRFKQFIRLYTRVLGSMLLCGLLLNQGIYTTSFAAVPNTALARYDYENDIFHPVYAKKAMVATEQALATQVGLEILKQGGNAIDAAVAVGFALAVVLPNAGNIGGGGFLVWHDGKSAANFALDFREVAPHGARENMYLDRHGQVIPNLSTYSHLAVGVPGTVAGLTEALQKWGSMSLAEVMAPAIALAEKGFIIDETLGKLLQVEQENLAKWPSTREIFFKQHRPLQQGERLIQSDLAHSLKLIAQQGRSAFYQGEIAQKIVAEIQQHQGVLSLDDLKRYQVAHRAPLIGDYRGYKIVAMPPPSSGGIHVIEMLNMLEHFPIQQYGANSAQSIHLLSEVMKRAYADRSIYLGDPDFVKVPTQGLISKRYAAQLARQISLQQVTPSAQIQAGHPIPYESDQTTHYSIVDSAGNAVAVTYTLNLNFGSGIVAKGTGILLNNEMDDFSAKAGVANSFGLTGGQANAIVANKRPLSSMAPTLLLKDDKVWLVTGSPGGSRIITTILQTIVNMVDFKMNPAEAAATPRIHHQWLPDTLYIEKGISADSLAILRRMGYKLEQKATMGRTQSIQILADGIYGYSDPRNPSGATMGY